MNFDTAFETLITHEGGYVNNPRDPGGETKYGISKRSYPAEDIPNLTLARARFIYKRDFWDTVRGDELPYDLAYNLFAGAVNSGRGQAVRWLQRAVRVADDGKFGPLTLAAVLAADLNLVVRRYNGERLKFMTDLSNWHDASRGWARRIANNLKGDGHNV